MDIEIRIRGDYIEVGPWEEFVDSVTHILITQPFTTIKTLMHLGYEPFPGQYSTTVRGDEAYYLPNIFSYARQFLHMHTFSFFDLYTGSISSLAAHFVKMTVKTQSLKFIDLYFLTLAQAPFDTLQGLDERQITDIQSLQRFIRKTLRETIPITLAIIASSPFQVEAIRRIAQMVGEESKYVGWIPSLSLIKSEEGIQGLFAGLIPQLSYHWLLLWGSAGMIYAMERILVRSGIDQATNPDLDKRRQGENILQACRGLIRASVPMMMMQLQTYSVVSNIMACVRSGMAVSLRPYNSQFNNYCYAHHRPMNRQNIFFSRRADLERTSCNLRTSLQNLPAEWISILSISI